PEQFVAALHRRRRAPRLTGRGEGLRLELAFEPSAPFSLKPHDLGRRIELLDREGTDRAVISISTPVGCEALPADEAAPLIAAYNDGAAELVAASRGRLEAFAATVVDAPETAAADLARQLEHGFAGLSLPSEAVATVAALDRIAPLLSLLEQRGRPLFVHPGPAPWSQPDPAATGLPGWWTSLGLYPAQSQRAFFTWRAAGAGRHPDLRVIFAIMAGGSPYLEDRYRTFARVPGAIDPNVFLDTASSQRLALDLALSTYGADQVVYGTDIPVIDPAPLRRAVEAFGPAVAELLCERNPARALDPTGDFR
ncbi:MAG TPA: amidohydrolase family protein, partial [Gaiellales bacterium]|nr:amidohydrolase family protein [Gaiellales bacterium]